MSRKYKFWDHRQPYFVSFAVINWIDLFVRRSYKETIVESLNYAIENKGLILYAWIIMPSHLHLIISSEENELSDIMRDFKSYTSRELKEKIRSHPQESRKEWMTWMMERAGRRNSNNKDWQLWMQHNQPIELDTNYKLDQKMNYLHENPVKAGFVDEPEHWLYSSARDYTGGKGLIKIDTSWMPWS